MKGRLAKKIAVALSVLFLSTIGVTSLASCKGKDGDNGGTENVGGNNQGENNEKPNTGNDEEGEVTVTKETDNRAISFTTLSEVKTTDAYTVNALDKEYTYLTETLDYEKLLYWFYKNADLTPTVSASYGGGWEGALIGGHTLGHYLSALAQGYANAGGTQQQRDKCKKIIDAVVKELKACQDNAETAGAKAGFLWGAKTISKASTPEIQFDNVQASKTNITSEAWVPWYTMHKIIAGLYDVTVYTGSEEAKSVLLNLCDWVYNRVSGWSGTMKKRVLNIEYGGMNDILYSVYELTGEEKYAVAAHMFDEDDLFDKVLGESDNYLNNKHANTTIPKILGALNRYVVCNGKTVEGEKINAENYLTVAELFWERVIGKHTYVTGGNSEWEHFGRDNVLDAERTNCNCETCNTYNMLKLSRTLFTITRDKKYLDYYERTYYNAIWSSQNPETGMTTYFQPMATGYFKVYSTAESNFWCCTGSGMESMTKLNDSIYYDAGNATYVSLYLSSVYESESVRLTQTADLETSDTVKIKVDDGETILRLRVPEWTKSYAVKANGKAVDLGSEKLDFISLSVKKGDEIELTLEKTIKAYNLPDGENVYAFKWGPFVLSAELGTDNMDKTRTVGVGVTVPGNVNGTTTESGHDKNAGSTYKINLNESVSAFIQNIDTKLVRGEDGKFTLQGKDLQLTYSVHYRQYTQRYGIYMTFIGGEEKPVEEDAAWSWETVDTRQPGYGQYETDLSPADGGSVGSTSDANAGGTTRYALAGQSFSYTAMQVTKGLKNRLVVSFAKEDNGKTIKITTGAITLYSQKLNYKGTEQTYSVEIAIPDSVIEASEGAIPVTFASTDGADSARICGFVYMQAYTFNTKAQDGSIAYFVDCGDFDPYTLSKGDKLGKFNSITEQVYGQDRVTGKYWGILDESETDLAAGKGHTPESGKGIATNSTWAYEYATDDGVAKTATNRYTKDQYESGVARNLHYKFELADGTYTVKMYFVDPWDCSKTPTVKANGESKITNGAVNQELCFTVTVSGGYLTLDITTTDLCINLSYIIIA